MKPLLIVIGIIAVIIILMYLDEFAHENGLFGAIVGIVIVIAGIGFFADMFNEKK